MNTSTIFGMQEMVGFKSGVTFLFALISQLQIRIIASTLADSCGLALSNYSFCVCR